MSKQLHNMVNNGVTFRGAHFIPPDCPEMLKRKNNVGGTMLAPGFDLNRKMLQGSFQDDAIKYEKQRIKELAAELAPEWVQQRCSVIKFFDSTKPRCSYKEPDAVFKSKNDYLIVEVKMSTNPPLLRKGREQLEDSLEVLRQCDIKAMGLLLYPDGQEEFMQNVTQ